MLLTPVRLILGRFKCFVQVLSNDPNIGIALTSKYSKYHDNLDIEAHQNSCHVITWHSSVHQIEFVFSCIFHPGISNPRFCHIQFSIPHRGHLMYLFSSRYFWTKMLFNWFLFLQESEKGQISYWSIQTCTRIMLSIDWLIDWLLTMLKKPQNCPISDFFDLYPNTFCPYCLIQTWYRLLLTQYHQVPTSTAVYWPSTIMDQPLPPYTDPVPPSTNK